MNVLGKMNAVTVILVAVIVVLAGAAVSAYALSQHYYYSKYRAQHILVESLLTSVGLSRPVIEAMIDDASPLYLRLARASIASERLTQGSYAAESIQVMYPDGSKESHAFGSVSLALDHIHETVDDYDTALLAAIESNNSYNSNSAVKSLYLNITDGLTILSGLISEGNEQGRDALESPYSHVNRMDLPSIEQACLQLEETCSALGAMRL